MNFLKCDNSSSNFTCKNEEEINTFLKGTVIGIYYLDYNIDYNNYEKPLNGYSHYEYLGVDLNNFKSSSIYFKKVQFSTDDSFFFSEEKVLECFMTEKITTENIGNINSTLVAQKQIISSPYLQQEKRVYQKFPQILANVSATANLFIIIGQLLLEIKSHFDIMKHILNKLFFFRDVLDEEFKEDFDEAKQKLKEENSFRKGLVYQLAKGANIKNEENNFNSKITRKLDENLKSSKINLELINMRKIVIKGGESQKLVLLDHDDKKKLSLNFFSYLQIKIYAMFGFKMKPEDKLFLKRRSVFFILFLKKLSLYFSFVFF